MNLDQLKEAKVLVIGDIMLDSYIKGNVRRISPEAPVPVLSVNERYSDIGGAGNVIRNLFELGCSTFFVGCVGDDQNGREIELKLSIYHAKYKLFKFDVSTINKIRIVGNHQQIVRVDIEEDLVLTYEQEQDVISNACKFIDFVDVIVISDYGKGFCTDKICRNLIENARFKNKIVIVDPKGYNWEKYSYATIITPNLKELADIYGRSLANDDNEITKASHLIRSKFNVENLLVTRSEKGMSLIKSDYVKHVHTEAIDVFDVSGAGDTVVATLAACLGAKFSLDDSIVISNRAAGVVVGKSGTTPIQLNELKHRFDNKIVPYEDVDVLIHMLKNENKSIVFTNGCFDVLHRGHINYLREARGLGDVLILGLNSDNSVKRLKGESRPINNQEDRAYILNALEFVDYIVIFEDDTPYALIKRIMPDILVKGGDYVVEEVVGREFAKNTVIIDFMSGYSSTNVINKLNR